MLSNFQKNSAFSIKSKTSKDTLRKKQPSFIHYPVPYPDCLGRISLSTLARGFTYITAFEVRMSNPHFTDEKMKAEHG